MYNKLDYILKKDLKNDIIYSVFYLRKSRINFNQLNISTDLYKIKLFNIIQLFVDLLKETIELFF